MHKILVAVFLIAASLMAKLPDSIATLLPGTGTKDDPYILNSASDFGNMNLIIYSDTNTKYHFKLVKDIVLDSGKHLSGYRGGVYHFDGGFHKITGASSDWLRDSFFSVPKRHTEIENLVLENVKLNVPIRFGGIVVDSCSPNVRISGMTVSGSIDCSGAGFCGGIVGMADEDVIITNVVNKANVKGKAAVGGIVGHTYNRATIVNAVNYGTIESRSEQSGYVGGIAGYTQLISMGFNRGDVSKGNIIGGIAGQIAKSSYVYNAGTVQVNAAQNVGILFGLDESYYGSTEENVVAFKKVYYEEGINDLPMIGYLRRYLNVEDSGGISHEDFTSKNFVEKMDGFFVADTSGENDGYPVLKKFFEGRGSADDPFLLKTKEDVVTMGELLADPIMNAYYGFQNYKLTNDIELDSTKVWHSANFGGTFDGGNHTIKGLYAKGDTAGFFGALTGAVVKNLGIVDSRIEGGYFAGAIAGKLQRSTINNCWNSNTFVYASHRAGGIVGSVATVDWGPYEETHINRVYNTGTITGQRYIGGLVGYFILQNRADGNGIFLSNGYNRGRVESLGYLNDSDIIGGIANTKESFSYDCIQNVYNAGPVIYETPTYVSRTYKLGFNKNINRYTNAWNLKAHAEIEGLTNEEMRSREFAETMGEAFAYDSLNVNDGYPILSGKDVKWKTVKLAPTLQKTIPGTPRITISSQNIFVDGLKNGQRLALVDLKGRKIWAGRATGNVQEIHVASPGIYLLKAENATVKVFVR